MKLVLEEYLRTLREKDELDILLCDLLLLDGYTLFNRPKTGERQFGVDILAKKGDDTYLFVVKQKDISRSSWNNGPDSVRQSMDDIFDVYLNSMLPKTYEGKRYHVVLATNGYVQAAVQPNWIGYQKNHLSWGDVPVIFEEWNIDQIVQMCSELAFDERLFGKEIQSSLRKVLYYMDENDFSNSYFEVIVDSFVAQLKKEVLRVNQLKKIYTAFYTCVTLMCHWAAELHLYKIAIDISEYSVIKIWEYMLQQQRFEDESTINWLIRFLRTYEKYNDEYIEEVREIYNVKLGITCANPIECRLITLEIIGRVCTYGLYQKNMGRKREAQEITNIAIQFSNSNPAFKYPVYDDNIIELTLFFLLMEQTGRKDLCDLLHIVIQGIVAQYIKEKTYPAPHDLYEEALKIYLNHETIAYDASILFGALLEWTCIKGMVDDFKQINEFIDVCFPKMTCQSWQLNHDEEDTLYSKHAAHRSGVSIPFLHHGDINEFRDFLSSINNNVYFDKFSFNEFSFESVALISCRYFHCPIPAQFWRHLLGSSSFAGEPTDMVQNGEGE